MSKRDNKDAALGEPEIADLKGTLEPTTPADLPWSSAGGQSLLRKSEDEMIARMDRRERILNSDVSD